MKIKRVKFYQAIEWESALVSYVKPDMSDSGGIRVNNSKPVTITRTDFGVILESEKDHVEVFAANIAYISYYPASEEPKKSVKVAK